MNDRPDDPESGAGEPKPPKMKAEDNPWYLLATLYGVPDEDDDGLREKNRVAWNRYFAANFNEFRRAQLVGGNRHPAHELRPFLARGIARACNGFRRTGVDEEPRASGN